MKFRLAGLVCSAILFAVIASAARALEPQQVLIEARIVEVSTGDSMQLLTDADLRDFRLHGVNAPAGDQPFAEEARAFTRSHVSGQELPVRIIDTDSYGRLIGDIQLPGSRSLGLQLITEGLAAWNHLERPDPAYAEAETRARLEGRGLWQIPELSRLPVLGGLFSGPAGGSDVDAIADAILGLSPGDRARLSSRLGGAMPSGYGGPRTIITTRDGYPVQTQDGARIIRRSSGRSSDLGIGVGDDGIRIRGGATERTHTEDTQIQVFGPSNGTMIIEEQVPYAGGLVYLTPGNKRFHRASCFDGRDPGHGFRRADALRSGYHACPRCHP